MTSEQLQASRALRWRQNSQPILTEEDAHAWLQQSGLCLFLPRRAQIPAPAPSFVEATLGESNATPPRTAIETSMQMVARLIESNAAVPLNLFGTTADHPDFIVSPDTLPFVYALRGDRDWKHAPGTSGTARVSPLVSEVWKLLERRGVLTASEIQDSLGRELTEAAVVRALYELWGSLRVTPLYQLDGEPTLWEALQTRHQKALQSAINMSQVTALSVLASLYFTTAVAATSEDAEIFLSPLSSRSKVREVIRGLTATRQLSMTTLDRETLLFVEGSLPEFEESQVEAPTPVGRRVPRRPFVPDLPQAVLESPTLDIRPVSERPIFDRRKAAQADLPPTGEPRSERPRPAARPFTGDRPDRSDRRPAARSFSSHAASDRAPRRERTPARPPWKDKGKPGFAKSPAARDPKARWPREGRPASKPGSFEPGPSAERKPFSDRAAGSRPPQRREDRGEFRPRAGNAFRPKAEGEFRPKTGGEFRPRTPGFAPRNSRPATGAGEGRPPRREGTFRPGREPRRESTGSSRPYASRPPRTGDQPQEGRPERPSPAFPRREGFKPKGDFRPKGDFKTKGDFKPKGDFKDFKPRRKTGESQPPSGARPTFRPTRPGGAPGGSRSFGGPRPTGARPFGNRPSGGRPSSDGPSGDRPAGPGRPRPEGQTGKPRFAGSGRPGPGKPSFSPRSNAGGSRPPRPTSAGSRSFGTRDARPGAGRPTSAPPRGDRPTGADRPAGGERPFRERSGPPRGENRRPSAGGFKRAGKPAFGKPRSSGPRDDSPRGRSTGGSADRPYSRPSGRPPSRSSSTRPPGRNPGRPSSRPPGGPKRRPE